jgi:hypothetical protein
MEPLIALPADFVEHRRKMIAQYGPRALDMVLAFGRCAPCGDERILSVGANQMCGFASLADFKKRAALLAEQLAKGADTSCKACKGPRKVSAVHYHAHHSGLDKDLILRWTPRSGLLSKPGMELLAWDPERPDVSGWGPLS